MRTLQQEIMGFIVGIFYLCTLSQIDRPLGIDLRTTIDKFK